MHALAFLFGLLAYVVFGAFFGLMVLGVGFMPEGPSRTFGTYFILLAPLVPTGLLVGRIAPSRACWVAALLALLALAFFVWSAGAPLPLVLPDSEPNPLTWSFQFLYQGVCYLAACIPAVWLGSKWRAAVIRSNHSFNPDAPKRAG